jgi:hypothetical protein
MRRAEALTILGQEFLRHGERTSRSRSGNKTEECVDESARGEGAKNRILRAFEISQMKVRMLYCCVVSGVSYIMCDGLLMRTKQLCFHQ